MTFGYKQILPKIAPAAATTQFAYSSVVHYNNNEPAPSTTSINYMTPAAASFKPVIVDYSAGPIQFTGVDPSSALAPVSTFARHRSNLNQDYQVGEGAAISSQRKQLQPLKPVKTMPISIAGAGFNS